MDRNKNDKISDEILAAFLDGNATYGESRVIMDSIYEDAKLRELLDLSNKVDAELSRGLTSEQQ